MLDSTFIQHRTTTMSVQINNFETNFTLSLFNNKKDNEPLRVKKSWKEFLTLLEQPSIREQKDGSAFSPASFNGKRANKNVESISMLVLDYDHEADLKEDLEIWKRQNLIFATYTTFSHLRKTNDNPNAEQRFRVILPLKTPIPKVKYSALWRWAFITAKEKIDVSTKDESRLYYLPAIRDNDSPYEYYDYGANLLDWTELSLGKIQSQIDLDDSLNQQDKFIFNELAEPPANKLDILLELDADFRRTWQKRRPNFNNDASRYDLSLATFAAKAGWSSQEILDLLVAFRRRHNLTPKSEKSGNVIKYYSDTLSKAKLQKELPDKEPIANIDLEDENNLVEIDIQSNDELTRQKIIKWLANRFNLFNLVAIKQFGSSHSTYALICSDGKSILLGSANELQQQSKVRAQLYDANAIMPKFSSNEWNEVLKKVRVVVEIVETESISEELLEYVKSYFGFNGIFGTEYHLRSCGIDFSDDNKLEIYNQLKANASFGFVDINTGAAYLPLGKFLEKLIILAEKDGQDANSPHF